MKDFRNDFELFVRSQKDGSFVVISKYLPTGKLDIISHHDTLEEADKEKEELQKPLTQPSQAEVMKQLTGMKNAIDDFKNNKL